MKTTITTMRTLALALFIAAATTAADAQGALKRVYDETLDPMTQIDEALAKASAGGKYVVCQVGGNCLPPKRKATLPTATLQTPAATPQTPPPLRQLLAAPTRLRR